MKLGLIVLFSILLVSCIKDYNSSTKSYIDNKTSHTITIMPYQKGFIDSTFFQTVQAFEKKLVYEESPRGRTLAPDFGTLLQPYDSILIIFDGTYKVTHLKFTAEITCDKCITFTSPRNISNPENYVKTITKDTKHYMVGYFTYTFSEQDYLDASK